MEELKCDRSGGFVGAQEVKRILAAIIPVLRCCSYADSECLDSRLCALFSALPSVCLRPVLAVALEAQAEEESESLAALCSDIGKKLVESGPHVEMSNGEGTCKKKSRT